MRCTLSDIRNKEVINIKTGKKIGYVDDVEFDSEKLTLKSLIIFGGNKFFGFLGHDNDTIIKCKDISLIGTDTILIASEETECTKNNDESRLNLFK